ncbi:MAG: hypothetical protein RJA70_3872, partial [Pseudomonadota bacterium]
MFKPFKLRWARPSQRAKFLRRVNAATPRAPTSSAQPLCAELRLQPPLDASEAAGMVLG